MTHPRCRKPHGLDGLVSIFAYQGLCKRVVGKLKYRLVTQAFPEMIEATVSLGDLSQFSGKEWVLVPVPLHPSRQRWRGFNQAEYIGQALAKYLHLDYEQSLLIRHKRTKSQMSLHALERSDNIKDAFSLRQTFDKGKLQVLRGKSILLIDDVYTTGATMKEAAKTLKRNGFACVWGLTLARTLHPGDCVARAFHFLPAYRLRTIVSGFEKPHTEVHQSVSRAPQEAHRPNQSCQKAPTKNLLR